MKEETTETAQARVPPVLIDARQPRLGQAISGGLLAFCEHRGEWEALNPPESETTEEPKAPAEPRGPAAAPLVTIPAG